MRDHCPICGRFSKHLDLSDPKTLGDCLEAASFNDPEKVYKCLNKKCLKEVESENSYREWGF